MNNLCIKRLNKMDTSPLTEFYKQGQMIVTLLCSLNALVLLQMVIALSKRDK